jgi:DNA-binding GntR family transcriptional regulator
MIDKTPLDVKSLSDQLGERIIAAILHGDLPPGSRISEATMAKMFGISRGPMREALYRLEGQRLVERTPNAGVKVVSPTVQDLADSYIVREALEGMAARLATKRMSDKQFDELEKIIDRHEAMIDKPKTPRTQVSVADLDFHVAILRGSGNDKIGQVMRDQLYYQMRLWLLKTGMPLGMSKDAIREHRAVLTALRARDPEAAEAAMRAHIRAACTRLKATNYDEVSAKPAAPSLSRAAKPEKKLTPLRRRSVAAAD